MDNYFIIHGSFSSPYSNWIGWLHDFIEGEGKQVYVPDFPIGVGFQNYENWSKLLKYYVDLGLINENTTIIGHSIAPAFISKFFKTIDTFNPFPPGNIFSVLVLFILPISKFST